MIDRKRPTSRNNDRIHVHRSRCIRTPKINRRTDGRYQTYYLPCFTVDNNVLISNYQPMKACRKGNKHSMVSFQKKLPAPLAVKNCKVCSGLFEERFPLPLAEHIFRLTLNPHWELNVIPWLCDTLSRQLPLNKAVQATLSIKRYRQSVFWICQLG